MEKMIAFCGLNCRECPAFIATQKDDDEARKKISKEWANEEFGIEPPMSIATVVLLRTVN